MIVIFGANGRQGRALVSLAVQRGLDIRPVVRDDKDARGLHKLVDIGQIWYADADQPEAIAAVLSGADTVISAINPRNAGPDSPRYGADAGANILRAAVNAGIERVIHLSVVGAYRWSPNRLNRASFRIDRRVRKLKDLPWVMFRFSCFMDEVLEGHVRPPDGGAPHPIVASGRYSPISREDAARVVLDALPGLIPSRTLYVGGPETFRGDRLEALIQPWLLPGTGKRTSAGQLPPGDVSVAQDTTRVAVGRIPQDRLVDYLDHSQAPTQHPPRPVYAKQPPGRHPSDQGRDIKVLRELGEPLRRVVHDQLCADLARLGHDPQGVELDFRTARPRTRARQAQAHGGTLTELTAVRATRAGEGLLHRGTITFLHDPLADELRIWWDTQPHVPEDIWRALDMGVRRRLAKDPRFADDPKVRAFTG